ncbi:Yos1-like-domain-containing protein [Aspergillus granulosus]|uniref:Yos1-like-domain-containing protein n=1 Tax=Aspergillus granulosus TaxID=176169 RepID=A0ABR4GYS0_9EURO
MSFFGLGRLVYGALSLPALLPRDCLPANSSALRSAVTILLINSMAILSEDRFLARIGFGRTQADPAFGASYDSTSVKAKIINLIASVRTVARIPLIVINTIIIVYELILG